MHGRWSATGFEASIWPTKEAGRGVTQRTFPGLQTQGGKVQGKQRLQRSPQLLQNISSTLPFWPNHGAWTHQLPAHCSSIREQQ